MPNNNHPIVRLINLCEGDISWGADPAGRLVVSGDSAFHVMTNLMATALMESRRFSHAEREEIVEALTGAVQTADIVLFTGVKYAD